MGVVVLLVGGGGGGGGGGDVGCTEVVVIGMVTVVGPCGPVVTITRCRVVVAMPGWVVVADVAAVVGMVVGRRETVVVSAVAYVLTSGPVGSGFGGLAVFVFALTAATVASTVARPTPDAARTTIARDLARLSVGGAI